MKCIRENGIQIRIYSKSENMDTVGERKKHGNTFQQTPDSQQLRIRLKILKFFDF